MTRKLGRQVPERAPGAAERSSTCSTPGLPGWAASAWAGWVVAGAGAAPWTARWPPGGRRRGWRRLDCWQSCWPWSRSTCWAVPWSSSATGSSATAGSTSTMTSHPSPGRQTTSRRPIAGGRRNCADRPVPAVVGASYAGQPCPTSCWMRPTWSAAAAKRDAPSWSSKSRADASTWPATPPWSSSAWGCSSTLFPSVWPWNAVCGCPSELWPAGWSFRPRRCRSFPVRGSAASPPPHPPAAPVCCKPSSQASINRLVARRTKRKTLDRRRSTVLGKRRERRPPRCALKEPVPVFLLDSRVSLGSVTDRLSSIRSSVENLFVGDLKWRAKAQMASKDGCNQNDISPTASIVLNPLARCAVPRRRSIEYQPRPKLIIKSL